MQTTSQIRQTFIDFFKGAGHEHVSSSPLVPLNDPTLMFTNAGMVQFKNVFTGNETRPYTAACHLAEVRPRRRQAQRPGQRGHTARHHTFFEMLGNFSFGDYFKEEAIDLAWALLITEVLRLPAERLLVTVHTTDDEAAATCGRRSSACPDGKIIRIPTRTTSGCHGRDRPLRSVLGDLLRPRPGTSPAARPAAGRGRRPLHRDLEPRVHAVRPQPRRASCNRCPGPPSTPAWAWNASPPCCRASTTTTTSTCCAP